MNVAAFAVVVARERVSEHGDDLASLEDLGRSQPWLAWPMTIAMLSLAGFPATAGFIGKFYLIDAAVAGDYAWLGIVIVIGSMVSLAYYLRVVAVMWMGQLRGRAADASRRAASSRCPAGRPRPTCAPSPRWPRSRSLFAAATILFGILPAPLFDAARDVGTAISGLRYEQRS